MSAGYDTLNKILKMTEKDLLAIKGMGNEKIKALLDGLKANEKMIAKLLEIGVEPVKKTNNTDTKTGISQVAGKHICITGKTSIKREALAKLIENSGGFFDKAVSKNTHYLCMVKSDSETIKAQKAQAMGVTIIDETELMKMIGE
jgi:NAD-dependent DNA ligase